MLYYKVGDRYRLIFSNSQMHEYIIEILRHESIIHTCNSDKVQMREHSWFGNAINDDKNIEGYISTIFQYDKDINIYKFIFSSSQMNKYTKMIVRHEAVIHVIQVKVQMTEHR